MSEVAVYADYIGLVANERNGNRFLVDEIQRDSGVISIHGPSIKRDGTLAKTTRIGTFPQICTFEEWCPKQDRDADLMRRALAISLVAAKQADDDMSKGPSRYAQAKKDEQAK